MADAVSDSAGRVLLLAGEFEVRGSTSAFLRLAERLPGHGLDPLVVCSSASRLPARIRRDVAIHEYPGLTTRIIGRLVRHQLCRDLRLAPPDVIHVQSLRWIGLGGWLASAWRRPLVVSVNEVLGERERLRLPGTVRRVLALSEAVSESLRERGGIAEGMIEVIPAGVDRVDPISFGGQLVDVLDSGHVACVGTAGPLESVKGLAHFLGAARTVLAAGRDVEFLVAGAGPEESNLRRLAGELGIRGRVTFLPNRPDFSDALAAMDVFCLPSLQQGLGTILLEAMSMGRPVIATGVGGVASVVRDGETGLVVPPGDSTTLARRILELLDDPTTARAIGNAGQADVVARFGTTAMVRSTMAVYNDVMETSADDSGPVVGAGKGTGGVAVTREDELA